MNRELTSSKVTLGNGRIAHKYGYAGRKIRVFDDAENALLIIDLFKNGLLGPEEKLTILVSMLFVDPEGVVSAFPDDFAALLAHIVWEVCGLDIDGSHKNEYESQERCLDWEQDAARIRTTLLQSYGVYWDDIKGKMTYAEVCELLTMAPHESPFGQAVYYRVADEPEPTKYNEKEREHFRKAREFFALKDAALPLERFEAENNKSNDMFAALKRKAVMQDG